MMVLQQPLMTIKQLINIATLRHFRHMTIQKSVQLQRAKPPPLTPDSCYRLELRARHNMGLYAPPISTPGSAPDWLAVTPADECISVSRGLRRYR